MLYGVVPAIIDLMCSKSSLRMRPSLLDGLRTANYLALSVRQCEYCGLDPYPGHIDHIIPRSRGGSDGSENLAIACVGCNSAKRTDVWVTANGRAGAFRDDFPGSRVLPPPRTYEKRLPETIQKYTDAWDACGQPTDIMDGDMEKLRAIVEGEDFSRTKEAIVTILSLSSDKAIRHNLVRTAEDAFIHKQCISGHRVDVALCAAMYLTDAALQNASLQGSGSEAKEAALI